MAVLDRWNTAVAAGNANWVAVGDSITQGQGASTRGNRWIQKTLGLIRAQSQPGGVTGGVGYVPAWYGLFGPDSTWEAWTSRAGSYADETWAGNLSYHQTTLTVGTPHGSAVYTVTGTDADIWYVQAAGSFTWQVDGGTATTVVGSGSFGQAKTRISLGTAGSHTITITDVSTSTNYTVLTGIVVFNGDTTSGMRLFDAAHSGYKSSDYTANSSSFAEAVALCAPDLVTIALSTNDLATLTAAQTKTNLVALITAIRAAATVQPSILVTSMYKPQGNAQWAATDAAIRSIITDDPTVGLLDFSTPMGETSPGGYWSTDNLHPSDSGHDYMSRIAATTLGVTIATVTPPAHPAAYTAQPGRARLGALQLGTAATVATAVTAALAGAGTLTATATPRFAVAAALTGAGTLTAAVTEVEVVTGTLTGTGTLAATVTPRVAVSAALAGAGTLTATSVPSFAVAGTFAGAGNLSGTVAEIERATATLGGTGTLSATATATVTAQLTGTGTLTATAVEVERATATLAGSGTLTATATPALTAALTGSGTLTASAVEVEVVAAAFVGAGSLTATVVEVETAAASFSGSGALTATVVEVEQVPAALTGSGTLTASVVEREFATATLSGTGTLSASVSAIGGSFSLGAALNGAGALTAAVQVAVTASLAGAGTLTATAAPVVTASLSGSGALTATAQPAFTVTANLSGTGTLAAGAVEVEKVTAALAGSGTLSATASAVGGVANVTAALTGTGALSATATLVAIVTASFSGSGALTATAVQLATVAANLTGTGALTASVTQVASVNAQFAGTGTLSATVRASGGSATITATLAGMGALTATVTVVGVAYNIEWPGAGRPRGNLFTASGTSSNPFRVTTTRGDPFTVGAP